MRIQLILCLTFMFFTLNAQKTFTLDYCNCLDTIDEIEPTLNGNYKRTCDNKIIIEGQFKDGVKDGPWITKSKNGKVIRKLVYSNGLLDQSIELFYSSGVNKLKGSFKNGKKDGKWEYYNTKGAILKEGTFKNGTPVGLWKVYNKKGKKETIVYDFDKNTYLKNNSDPYLFEKAAIVQQDNTHEWFIRQAHNNHENDKFQNKPFEGYPISLELHTLLMEIPMEIWDTYVSQNYSAKINFEKGSIKSVNIELLEGHLKNVPEIGFFAITNDDQKLKRIDHNPLTMKLLEYNLSEAIWLTGPWISNDDEITIYIPYVINDFKGRKF